MTFVSSGKNIPTNTTSIGPRSYPIATMKMGAQAIGAIGLRISIMGVENDLRDSNFPRMSPKGIATSRASPNPLRNVLILDPM